ncbi:hypothetical protein UlMin_044568 [Ulmus minor]
MASPPSSLSFKTSNKTMEASNECSGFRTAPSTPPSSPPRESSFSEEFTAKNQSPSSEISSPPSPSKPGFTQQVSLPDHFLLKIVSFSMLSKASIMKYRSSEFEAGGYKWILSVYPIGNKTKDAQDHISIYLELADTTKLATCWEINSTINFFIYDHVRDKYVSRQDAKVKRFHGMKTQWGIPKFIDHETFNNPSNGYLVNDSCTFGVEVFVVKNTFKVEGISMIRSAVSCKYSWKFDLVSSRTNQEVYESKEFFGADYKWSILFLPNGIQGDAQIWNNYITVGLKLDTSNFPSGKKLFTHFTLRMKDQINNDDYERSDTELISLRVGGFRRFMALTKFRDPEKGFLVNDACIVEAEFEVLGIVTVE